MKANLIILDTQSATMEKYAEVGKLLQNILIQGTVEIASTTVFCDFEDVWCSGVKFLGELTIIVYNTNDKGNMLKELDKLISQYYGCIGDLNASIVNYSSQKGTCVLLDMQMDLSTYTIKDFGISKYPQCVYMQLFGLTKENVKVLYNEIPNNNNFDIAIINKDLVSQVSVMPKNQFSKEFVDEFLRNLHLQFQKYWLGDTADSMVDKLLDILSIRQWKIAVADALTQGYFGEFLAQNARLMEEYVVEVSTVFDEYDYEMLGVSSEFLETHTHNGVDMAYEMSAVMMEKGIADIVVSLCGEDDAWFVSIGDKQAIHVYKFARQECENIICNQAIFKLLKKLRENQLYFFENSV